MKYLFPQDNLLTAATGYVPLPGSINTRTAATKSGGGVVSLTGGAIADATYDIEIVNNTIVGTPTVSAPTFVGVGNPVMSSLAATAGVAAQVFTVTLTDLGTDTEFAYTPFQGVNLVAKTSGSGGNSIVVEVNESGITRTGTDFALLQGLVKDQNEYVGEEWNFGAPALNPDGSIPSAAPRISFGDDPQVYRQYREFVEGRYVYRFSPAPVRDVGEGARVKIVTGSRIVTTFNGVTTRTYNTVTTLYSLLAAILADASAHVDVDGVVTVDNRPGGMGVTEMSVRTVSYVQSIERDGTTFVRTADLPITVTDDAPTEILTITCSSSDYIGAEVWSVRGSVSGELADAVTAVAYDGTDYDFTIPQILAPGVSPAAFKTAYLELQERSDGEAEPLLCLENFVLGAEAVGRTYTFTWRTRPPECNCDDANVVGGPDGEILGTEDDPVGTLIPATLQTRLQDLYSWKRTFIAAQASILAPTTAITGETDNAFTPSGSVITSYTVATVGSPNGLHVFERLSAVLKIDRVDIDAAEKVTALFHACLRDVYDTNSEVVPGAAGTAWDTAFTDMQAEFATLSTLSGGENWRKFSRYLLEATSGATVPNVVEAEAQQGLSLLTEDIADFLKKYRALLEYVAVLGAVEPDFEGATRPGNDVWQDQGGTAWFESKDGLLPIQPGFYYHSCRLGENGEPVATMEFGIGVALGCPEAIRSGDRLIITIAPTGNIRVTYQVGDQFVVRVINGSPVALGGGQTGTDTQVWRVRGSTAGVLTNYNLFKPTPNTYSVSGLSFLITPGGIDSALGDEFEFYIEGGQFRYRKNGGGWSANTQIAASVNVDTAGGATIAAAFLAGEAPSWTIGDSYSFSVTALNTLARICSPVHGGSWYGDGSADLRITYPGGMENGTADHSLFVRNENGSAITINVSAIFDEVAVETIACTALPGENIFDLSGLNGVAGGEYLEVQCDTDAAMEMMMLWLGTPYTVDMPNTVADPGTTRKRIKLGNASRSSLRLGSNIQHSAVSQSSFDEFIERLNDAIVNHDGRFAVAWSSDVQSECGIVQYPGDDLDVEEEFDFHPTATADRLLRFTMPLEAVE